MFWSVNGPAEFILLYKQYRIINLVLIAITCTLFYKGFIHFVDLVGAFKGDRNVVLYTLFGDVNNVTTFMLETEPLRCEITVQSDQPIAAAIHKALSRQINVRTLLQVFT